MENYKTTKTIRFKLKAIDISTIQSTVESINSDENFNLIAFVSDLNNFIDNLNEYLFYKNKRNEFVINDKLTIKNEWLKQFAKQEFYDSESKRDKTKKRQIKTIGDFDSLALKIEKQFDEMDTIYAELATDAGAELNERARKARTGLLLKRLASKNVLPFFVSLIENSSDKNEKGDLSIRLKRDGKKLEEKLPVGINFYLPEQSNGIPIAKASFNYYTINKQPVDYVAEIKKQQELLKNIDYDKVFLNSSFSKEIKNEIKENVPNYEELRQRLKNIKACQKAQFNELMTQDLTYEQLKANSGLYLFNDIGKQDFDNYKEKTEAIEEKSTKINQCNNEDRKKQLRSELQKLKKERGALINAADKRHKSLFRTYKEFANLYRNVAQTHGRILSTLKGIEKERTESQLLSYWALILEENNRHKLILIPKGNASNCYKWIITNESIIINNNPKLYWFESLTFRSLRKLCFGNIETGTNTFNENIRDILNKHKYYETVLNQRTQTNEQKSVSIDGEFSFKGDEQKIINFYKDVLDSQYAQSVLNFPKEQVKNEIINTNFVSLDDFQIALEKICYKRYVLCPKNIKSKLKEYNTQIFDITSLDLRNPDNIKDKEIKYNHSDKQFTQIWKDFWTQKNEDNNFDIRLNPEITITWRNAKENRIAKYGKDSKLYDERKNNRYLHTQFTLVTTISEHSNTPTKIISFLTDDEYENLVDEFNRKFKSDDIKFAIGIDNGMAELSTLGIYLSEFAKNSNEETIAEIKNMNKNGFNTLTIKDLSYSEKDINDKSRKIIQNSSYFINKELYMRTFEKSETEYEKMFEIQFEKKRLLTLDLTIAKVINGYIITNGDISTHLNLRIRNAQRLVYEMNDHSQKNTAQKVFLKSNSELTDEEKMKFVESLFIKNSFSSLGEIEKRKYVDWTFNPDTLLTIEEEQKFKNIRKHQTRVGNFSKDNLFAIAINNKKNQDANNIFNIRDVFQLRDDFYAIKSEKEIRAEIELFNERTISNEELDLKINHLKQSIVGNAIGVIDFLYKYYAEKTNAKGLIVKEGFDTKKVAEDLEKFSGNIYRILERKLYQKFQNYGLVPPIKNLMVVREDGISDKNTHEVLRLGNIGFVSKAGTSQNCPVCETKFGNHLNNFACFCGFSPENIMHSNDGIAGYNIAKRGFTNTKSK